MLRSFAIACLMLVSNAAFAGYPEDVCRGLDFDFNKLECAKLISSNDYDSGAVDICSQMGMDVWKLNCLKTIANKSYTRFELSTCANMSIDFNKENCLKQTGQEGGLSRGGHGYPNDPRPPRYPNPNDSYEPQPPQYNPNAEYIVRRQVRCESEKGRTDTCNADLRDISSARLIRQLSKTTCVENQNYSFNGDQVQVTAGCRATFEFAGITNNVQPNDQVDGELVRTSLTCESNDRRTRTCGAPSMRQVLSISLDRQLSKAPCVEGQSYVISGNTVTVSQGCRAQFTVKGIR